jgi:hypothetical protein
MRVFVGRTRRGRRARGAARSRRAAHRRRRWQGPSARALINWARLAARAPGVSLHPVEVNGAPGALYLDAQRRVLGVVALDTAGPQITGISAIVNPDKLAHLGPVGDLRALLQD